MGQFSEIDAVNRHIPTMFVDEDDVCEHQNLSWECRECYEDGRVDSLIDEGKEENDD